MRTFKSTLMALALVVLPASLTPAIAIAATEADTKEIEATYYAVNGKAISSDALKALINSPSTLGQIQENLLNNPPLSTQMSAGNYEQVVVALYTNLMGTPPDPATLTYYKLRLANGALTPVDALNKMLATQAPPPARSALFAAPSAPVAASSAPATTTTAAQSSTADKVNDLPKGSLGAPSTSEELLQRVNALLDSAEDLKIEEEDNTPSYQRAKASLGAQAGSATDLYNRLAGLKQSLQSGAEVGTSSSFSSTLESLQTAVTAWQNAMGASPANTAATNTGLTNQAIGSVNAVNDAVVRDVLRNTTTTPKCHLVAIPHTYPTTYQTVCN